MQAKITQTHTRFLTTRYNEIWKLARAEECSINRMVNILIQEALDARKRQAVEKHFTP